MTDPSIDDNAPPRRSSARRREAMINAVATVLGCMALVIMIATVIRVVTVKLWDSAKVNPEYVQSVYDSANERRWSGNPYERHALLDESAEVSPAPAPPQPPPAATEQRINLSRAATGPSATPPPVSAIENIESKRLKIENTIRGFFETTDVEQKLAYARDPQRVRPLMVQYYHNHPQTHFEWKSLGWVLPVEEPGYRLGYAQAIFNNAEPVSLIIEEQVDGSFRVDWESSVRYGELDWEEFIKTQPASPKLFRVIASRAHNAPPGESPQGSEVLEIKHPDESDVIYADFDRADPKFEPLIQQLQTGNWKDVPLTLRLCYPGPAGSGRRARIADVEGKGWLMIARN